jgi:2-iminobutanoate/2-iminopropanoate deaminase
MKSVFLSSEETNAPLSGAIEINGLVYISGQIPFANGKLEGDTIEERLDVVMSNIKRILAEAKLSLEDVVRIQLYLTRVLPS